LDREPALFKFKGVWANRLVAKLNRFLMERVVLFGMIAGALTSSFTGNKIRGRGRLGVWKESNDRQGVKL
jgi:hypothetical protein